MTHTFEIREEPVKVYPDSRKPFVIYNEKNVQVGSRYATREEAQKDIDLWTKPVAVVSNPVLDDLLDTYEGKPQVSEPEPKETEDQIVIDSQEQVGSIIEFHGDKWLVVNSRYTSAEEAAEIEEEHDAYVQPGWESVLRKVKR